MKKPPRVLVKQIENFENIIEALNGLIDGSKIKLQNYDKDFLEKLSDIRKNGLELRDKIQLFKNDLESSLSREYGENTGSRFASEKINGDPKKVVESFMTRSPIYE